MSNLNKHDRAALGLRLHREVGYTPTPFNPGGALRVLEEYERTLLIGRIMRQRRELKFMNRAIRRRDDKHTADLAKKREVIARLRDRVAELEIENAALKGTL